MESKEQKEFRYVKAALSGGLPQNRSRKYMSISAYKDSETGKTYFVKTYNNRTDRRGKDLPRIIIENKPKNLGQYSPKNHKPEVSAPKIFENTLNLISDLENDNISTELRKILKQNLYHYQKDSDLIKELLGKQLNGTQIEKVEKLIDLLDTKRDLLIDNVFIDQDTVEELKEFLQEILDSESEKN